MFVPVASLDNNVLCFGLSKKCLKLCQGAVTPTEPNSVCSVYVCMGHNNPSPVCELYDICVLKSMLRLFSLFDKQSETCGFYYVSLNLYVFINQ